MIIIIIKFDISQIPISFSCICPLIDDKLCRDIVKVAVEPRAADEWFHNKPWQCYDKINASNKDKWILFEMMQTLSRAFLTFWLAT